LNGDLDNSCIKLGESFKQALLDDAIQTEPTEQGVWINSGNANVKFEANFVHYKKQSPYYKKLQQELNIESRSLSGQLHNGYGDPLYKAVPNNASLKEKYYKRFSEEWQSCVSLYNQSTYKRFWIETAKEFLLLISLPFVLLAVGALIMRFGHWIVWPFVQIGTILRRAFLWLLAGFKN